MLKRVLSSISAEIFSAAIEKHESCLYIQAAHDFDLCARLNRFGHSSLDAYFNTSSILQMIGFPDLAVFYLKPILLRGGGARLVDDHVEERKEDKDEDAYMDEHDKNEDELVLTAHQFLWALAQHQYSREEAIELYREMALCGDLRAQHKLATLINEGKSALHGNPEYARKVFDQLAPIFEERLTDRLGYDIPRILEQEVSRHMNEGNDPELGSWRILDLGCGSGLCGKAFSAYSTFVPSSSSVSLTSIGKDELMGKEQLEHLMTSAEPIFVGIDISGKMIDLCLESGCYSHTIRCSLQKALDVLCKQFDSQTGYKYGFDLIIAADTFIYVGALSSTFKCIHKILVPNGIFAFSIEEKSEKFCIVIGREGEECAQEHLNALDRGGCELQNTSRYGHNSEYIVELARIIGFEIVLETNVTLRVEFDVKVRGCNFLLRKI